MKLEDLTWVEALQAYADGLRVADKDGDTFWIDAHGAPQSNLILNDGPSPLYAPFRIVKQEPKKLTNLEDVLKCNRVCVKTPRYTGTTTREFRKSEAWAEEHMTFFGLALSQGWPIEEIVDDAM
jgi:hypothetical protein